MTSISKPFVLGAVAYDPKVVTIWEGFRVWLQEQDFPFDYVLYSNYERQVEDLVGGRLDVAWNSPLAWLQAVRLGAARGVEVSTIAMRDTDRDLTSVVLVRADGPASLGQIRRLGVGAADSPQATLIPLLELAEAGASPEVVRHDVLIGKHGDHIGGEREAVKALLAGTVDAACVIDGNRLGFTREGLLPQGATRVLHQTGRYDHCNMTVVGPATPERTRFAELLLAMSYDDPVVRPLLDLEGLKQWVPGRTSGYALLERAIDRFGTIDPWLARAARAR